MSTSDFDPRCRRCASESCVGRYRLSACPALIDGVDAFSEAFALLDVKYSKPRPAELELDGYELFGGDTLVPWDGELDRRPKAGLGPRLGEVVTWAAKWGECTACRRDKTPMRAAKWRQARKSGRGAAAQSLCDEHARTLVAQCERIKHPMQVPEFTTAAEALDWLDRQDTA